MDTFINEYEMTEDLYVEQYSHAFYFWASMLFIFASCMFAISGWWVLLGLTVACLFVIGGFAVREQIVLQKAYKAQLQTHGNQPYAIHIEFLPTTIKFVTSYGANEELPYSAILKSHHKTNLIVFEIDRGYNIAIKKDSFTSGSLTCFVSAMSVRGL